MTTLYVPRHRNQFSDPSEARYSHATSSASAHRAANCTMCAGATALEAHTRGKVNVNGGDLRHRSGDLVGGTDLADLKRAWAAYGQTLVIKSGQGWTAVKTAHNEGRGVVLQGDSDRFGNSTCSGKYDGDHCVYVGPMSRHNPTTGSLEWKINDSICTYSRWERAAVIRDYAVKLNPRVQFAVTRKLI